MRTSGEIPALLRLKQAAAEKVALDPGLVHLLLIGTGGAALGAGMMHARDEANRARTKNTAFGAGVAAGLAGPHIVGALNRYVNPAHSTSGTETPQ